MTWLMVRHNIWSRSPPTREIFVVQLLVSVSDAEEAAAAVAGGADIVDAKDPHAGALGPVQPPVLRGIRRAVAAPLRMSAALGDKPSPEFLRGAILAAKGLGLSYVKLGFAGVCDARQIAGLLTLAVEMAGRENGAPGIVAVAYADWRGAGGPEPARLIDVAVEASAAAVLLDTAIKDGHSILHLLAETELASMIGRTRESGMLCALAGGLHREDVPVAAALGPDIIGVRGAACVGGRRGRIRSDRVASLRAALDGVPC